MANNVTQGHRVNGTMEPIPAGLPGAITANNVSQSSQALNDELARVTNLEAQKDYKSAIALLRQLVSANLQNAEVHHRLAVDLLAAGDITESISEFRIASALAPDKNDYAGDLARALAIHKRSQEREFVPSPTEGALPTNPGSPACDSKATGVATSNAAETGSTGQSPSRNASSKEVAAR